MENKHRSVGGGALLMLALMLLLLPLRWVGAAFLAAVFHELGHYVAVLLCGGQVRRMRIGAFHSAMEVTALSAWQEALCICAGPLAGALTVFLAPWLPLTALCGFIQTGYNLLPVYPLDGGRLLRCLARISHIRDRQVSVIEAVLFLLLMALVVTAGLRLGVSFLLGGFLLLSRALSGKIPCKRRQYWI